MKNIVTKGEFARMKNRAPSAISNWIADGRITQAALVGSGVRARIWVEQAERDLSRNLDPSQQIAQDHPLSLTAPAADAPAAPSPAPASAPLPAPAEDEDLRRRRRADADSAESQAKLNRLKIEREAGRWVEAAEVQKVFARDLAASITEAETWATQTLARALGDRFGLDWRELAVVIRDSWREHRASAAAAAARKGEAGVAPPPA